jgi:hypothetical protein
MGLMSKIAEDAEKQKSASDTVLPGQMPLAGNSPPDNSKSELLAGSASMLAGDAIKLADLASIISKIASLPVSNKKVMYVRATDAEKRMLEDFINIELYPLKLRGDDVSTSSLMRYMCLYVLKHQKDIFIQALKEGLKQDEISL